VLLATGRPFGHLPWQASATTGWANRWLESSFPFWARSILEQWHDGAFDAFDTVVFSRSDDASQRLYYYVSELRRRGLLAGPGPHIFDIAHVQRESSVRHSAAAVLDLCSALDVTPAALSAAIERANRLRRALADLDDRRATNGPLYERLARLALFSDPTDWIGDVGDPEAEEQSAEHTGNSQGAQEAEPEQERKGAQAPLRSRQPSRLRVLLAGSVPPDDRLHQAVEATTASVIAEAHVHGLARLGPAVAPESDTPERHIAEQLRRASVGPRALIDRAGWLVERATAARADAVILWLTREDEALAWHVPAARRALAGTRLPTLILPAARWQADDDTSERIAAFCGEATHATA